MVQKWDVKSYDAWLVNMCIVMLYTNKWLFHVKPFCGKLFLFWFDETKVRIDQTSFTLMSSAVSFNALSTRCCCCCCCCGCNDEWCACPFILSFSNGIFDGLPKMAARDCFELRLGLPSSRETQSRLFAATTQLGKRRPWRGGRGGRCHRCRQCDRQLMTIAYRFSGLERSIQTVTQIENPNPRHQYKKRIVSRLREYRSTIVGTYSSF